MRLHPEFPEDCPHFAIHWLRDELLPFSITVTVSLMKSICGQVRLTMGAIRSPDDCRLSQSPWTTHQARQSSDP
jgi:hypothetical protein